MKVLRKPCDRCQVKPSATTFHNGGRRIELCETCRVTLLALLAVAKL